MTGFDDLSRELQRIADDRITRIRGTKRIRAELKKRRDVGLRRRHAEKEARNEEQNDDGGNHEG